MSHPIPDDALDADIAILGKKGRGKTYTAKGIVERLLEMERRVVVLDPLSTWWGLRTSADGKSAGSGTLLKLERTAENHILVTGFEPLPELVELSVKDGFNTVDEFLDYFVPNNGDVFEGVLFRW